MHPYSQRDIRVILVCDLAVASYSQGEIRVISLCDLAVASYSQRDIRVALLPCYNSTVKVPLTGNGVTANMPALGAGDSGFESRFPD